MEVWYFAWRCVRYMVIIVIPAHLQVFLCFFVGKSFSILPLFALRVIGVLRPRLFCTILNAFRVSFSSRLSIIGGNYMQTRRVLPFLHHGDRESAFLHLLRDEWLSYRYEDPPLFLWSFHHMILLSFPIISNIRYDPSMRIIGVIHIALLEREHDRVHLFLAVVLDTSEWHSSYFLH